MKKTEGLIAAPYSPFDQKGGFNVDLIPTYGEYLKESGVRGVFVNGTTGEGGTLSTEERMMAAAAWVRQKVARFRVIIHVGYTSLATSQKLAEHANQIGADAIGLVPPSSLATRNTAELISYNTLVAAAAPDVPYYYYHIPAVSNVNLLMIEFLEQAEGRIPNLAGIKFTHEDLMDMKLCLDYADHRYDILHGRDEILLAGLSLGVKGAIGSTYNYMAPLFVRIVEAFEVLDLKRAGQLQLETMKTIRVLSNYGGAVKAGKYFMRMVGLDVGEPRLPAERLSAKEQGRMQAELADLGFLDHSGLPSG